MDELFQGFARIGCFHEGFADEETAEAVPVDVALGSFRVDVLTVGKVETAVIVLGVVSAVCSGSSVVSC